MLSERQIRWAALLSRFNIEILYRPGKQNVRANALSRREQDLPEDARDKRLQKRIIQVLKPTPQCYEEVSEEQEESPSSWVMSAKIRVGRVGTPPSPTEEQSEQRDSSVGDEVPEQLTELEDLVSQEEDLAQASKLEKLWLEALKGDRQHKDATQAVLDQEQRFPPSLGVKCSITECLVNNQGQLLYQGRKWVPNSENLRTRIISEVHDSLSAGHPGREITYKMIARDFFWPGMLDSIRRYVRNCDVCGRTKP
jgi:hypothetical protein